MEKFLLAIVSAVALVGCQEKEDAAVTQGSVAPDSGSQSVDVSPAELAGLLASKLDVVVIDIRTPAEFAEGHIEGAINIDFQADGFAEAIAKVDTDAPTVFHCRGGGRSGQAEPLFEALPFQELYHLSSGSMGWSDAGNPMVK